MKGAKRIAEVRVDVVDRCEEAAHWLIAFQPSISVDWIEGGLVLRSSKLTVSQLADAWLCALVNEQFLVSNAAGRETILADLLG